MESQIISHIIEKTDYPSSLYCNILVAKRIVRDTNISLNLWIQLCYLQSLQFAVA